MVGMGVKKWQKPYSNLHLNMASTLMFVPKVGRSMAYLIVSGQSPPPGYLITPLPDSL